MQDLFKHTSSNHPDYRYLESALNLVEQVAIHANSSMQKQEELKKLVKLEKSFVGLNNVEIKII